MTPMQADTNPSSVEIKQRKIIIEKLNLTLVTTFASVHIKLYLQKFIYQAGLQKYLKLLK